MMPLETDCFGVRMDSRALGWHEGRLRRFSVGDPQAKWLMD
jgi:hypothetical protein